VLQANGTVAVEPTIDADHVARAVLYMANLPLDVNVPFITVMASQMPFIGRGNPRFSVLRNLYMNPFGIPAAHHPDNGRTVIGLGTAPGD